eukprot:UN21102
MKITVPSSGLKTRAVIIIMFELIQQYGRIPGCGTNVSFRINSDLPVGLLTKRKIYLRSGPSSNAEIIQTLGKNEAIFFSDIFQGLPKRWYAAKYIQIYSTEYEIFGYVESKKVTVDPRILDLGLYLVRGDQFRP